VVTGYQRLPGTPSAAIAGRKYLCPVPDVRGAALATANQPRSRPGVRAAVNRVFVAWVRATFSPVYVTEMKASLHHHRRLAYQIFAMNTQGVGEVTGVSFIDSAAVSVCHVKRAKANQTFNGLAGGNKHMKNALMPLLDKILLRKHPLRVVRENNCPITVWDVSTPLRCAQHDRGDVIPTNGRNLYWITF
jgi:hypothetical protein